MACLRPLLAVLCTSYLRRIGTAIAATADAGSLPLSPPPAVAAVAYEVALTSPVGDSSSPTLQQGLRPITD